VLAAFKLWLVWTDEVVARASPYDQLRYVEMAQELDAGRWLGSYDHMTLVREPSYALWLAAVHRSGIPLRIASELLLLASAVALGAALQRAGVIASSALAVAALVMLAPQSLLVNREVLAAGFYLPMLLLATSGLVMAAYASSRSRRLAHAAWAGLALGLAWTSRPEKPIVVLLLLVFACLELLRARGAGLSPLRRAGRLVALLAPPVVAIALVSGAYAAVNRHHYGLAVTSELSGPGFVAASRELHGVPHVSPRRFVLVPRDARRRAYAASPALARLAPAIERPGWTWAVSCSWLEVCDDLGGSWFMWALREAVAETGHGGSGARADAYLGRVAAELAEARASGRLPPRRTTLSFLHPYPETWLPHLPGSLGRVAGRLVASASEADWAPQRDHPQTPAPRAALYDRMAGRRAHLVSNGRAELEGWVEGADDPVVEVALRPSPGPRAPRVPPERFEREGPLRLRFRFLTDKYRPRFLASGPSLDVRRASGATARVPIPEVGASHDSRGLRVHTERLEETELDGPLRTALRRGLWNAHTLLARALAAGGLVAMVVLAWPPWRGRGWDAVVGVAALLLALAGGRAVLLGLIDASTMPVASPRYVYPAVAPFTCGAFLLVVAAAGRLRAARRALPGTGPTVQASGKRTARPRRA
jgi:hypothetical protein